MRQLAASLDIGTALVLHNCDLDSLANPKRPAPAIADPVPPKWLRRQQQEGSRRKKGGGDGGKAGGPGVKEDLEQGTTITRGRSPGAGWMQTCGRQGALGAVSGTTLLWGAAGAGPAGCCPPSSIRGGSSGARSSACGKYSCCCCCVCVCGGGLVARPEHHGLAPGAGRLPCCPLLHLPVLNTTPL